MPGASLTEMRTAVQQLYDPESRPEMVKSGLAYIGAPAILAKVGILNGSAEKVVDHVAAMSTVAGLKKEVAEGYQIAAPYIAKARDPDGRKALVQEVASAKLVQDGKSMLDERVLKPLGDKVSAGKEYAAPYVASVKEKSAPYVEKLESEYKKIRRSERVEAMVSAFHEAREHPAEKVGELRSMAVDLIKYENLRSYRDHVMSAEFQADTARLLKHDLPELAKRGAETVKTKATMLATELDAYKAQAKLTASAMYEEKVPSKEELKAMGEKVKATTLTLVAELQAVLAEEISSGVTTAKADGFSLNDVLDRLKRVYGVVDTIVITPLLTSAKGAGVDAPPPADDEDAGDDDLAAPTPSKAAMLDDRPLPPPVGSVASSVADDDDMQSACEVAAEAVDMEDA